MDTDTTVKLKIYEMIARQVRVPDAFDLAKELDFPVEQVRSSYKRLYAKRLLVLEKDELLPFNRRKVNTAACIHA
jgi:hypothetical protein